MNKSNAIIVLLNGAAVEQQILPGGHELSQADVTVAQSWWNKHVPATSND
jgi:predicted esterase